MHRRTVRQLLQLIATPLILIFWGVLLIIRPDSASSVVGMGLGVVLIAAGMICGCFALRDRDFLALRAIPAAACLALGIRLMNNPLALASMLGRLAGIIIFVRGLQDILHAMEWKVSMSWAVAATLIGALLTVLPMQASRIVLILCGILVTIVGIIMLVDRLRKGNRLNPPEESSDIIDAL